MKKIVLYAAYGAFTVCCICIIIIGANFIFTTLTNVKTVIELCIQLIFTILLSISVVGLGYTIFQMIHSFHNENEN